MHLLPCALATPWKASWLSDRSQALGIAPLILACRNVPLLPEADNLDHQHLHGACRLRRSLRLSPGIGLEDGTMALAFDQEEWVFPGGWDFSIYIFYISLDST
jgi:hypothetical protein